MKTFFKWAEENKFELPNLNDTEPGQEVKGENTKRTGYSGNYPDAYVKGQYPHKYFNPIKATADLDKENDKKAK